MQVNPSTLESKLAYTDHFQETESQPSIGSFIQSLFGGGSQEPETPAGNVERVAKSDRRRPIPMIFGRKMGRPQETRRHDRSEANDRGVNQS